jgi:hypothetical protein
VSNATVFLSGSEDDDALHAAEEFLARFKWVSGVVNPHALGGCDGENQLCRFPEHTDECIVKTRVRALIGCSHVALMPTWLSAETYALEARIARAAGMGIIYITNSDINQEN